jgi:ATP-dependent Clp protease adaptor protein ClpS
MIDLVDAPVKKIDLDEIIDSVKDEKYSIVLYNDDVNSFDHVIECLMKYCKHTGHQAEQCALIVHYKGKYAVKNGSMEVLEPICQALLDSMLSAKIE